MKIVIKNLKDKKNINLPVNRAFILELIADIESKFGIGNDKEKNHWKKEFLKMYLKNLLKNKDLSRKQFLEEKKYILYLLHRWIAHDI